MRRWVRGHRRTRLASLDLPRWRTKERFCESSWRFLEAILGPSWGHLGPSWGHLGAILWPSWAHLGPSWAILGPSLGHLGESWVVFSHLEPILSLCWAHLRPSWDILGSSWAHLGPSSALWRPSSAKSNMMDIAIALNVLFNLNSCLTLFIRSIVVIL